MCKIEDRLYQGGRPGLFDNGLITDITAVVSLEIEEDNPLLYIFPTEWLTIRVQLPIVDLDYPGDVWLNMAVAIVEELHKAGQTVLIHCREGVSRSVMLTAAVLMREHGWNLDTAMNFIAKANPKLNPNPSFMAGLKNWKA